MKKVLCLVGATGTGKTKLALSLSRSYPSILISADSRQVYRGMDIVTGKDHPQDATLLGIDLVNPDQDCSVSVWYNAVKSSLRLSKLPIVVGGTGFYIKAITDGIPTMEIKPDTKLREKLEKLSLTELQKKLQSLSTAKYSSMNNSDINNPRRLIRGIEIASAGVKIVETANGEIDSLLIGLRHNDLTKYQSVVRERVIERLKLGAIEETKRLLEKYETDLPSLTGIGYRSIIQYLEGELTQEQMVAKWTADELAYAKRQLTWFKKVHGVRWFDVADPDYQEKIAKLVAKWYAKS